MTDDGRHVLWLSFPAFGHIKASLAMVEELRRRGHRVTYVVADRLADRVATTGARVVTYDAPFPEAITLEESATTMLVAFLEESFAPLETALALAAADPPDVVVHDALASDTAVAVSRRHRVPRVRTYPGFAANDQVPLASPGTDTSGREPVDPTDPRLAELGERLRTRVEAAGVAELLDLGAPGGASADKDTALNIACIPRAFQVGADTFGDGFLFAGPCLREADFAGQWSPPDGAGRTLLISLGTSVNRRPGFFRDCAAAFAGTDWHVVMTLGGGVDPDTVGPLPPNVEAHPWIPHLTVLEHASAFVCQGGINSLMEAFYQGVPVVVVPHQTDAVAAADQAAALGLGRVLPREDFDGAGLRAAVEAVAGDEAMRRNVGEMRQQVRAAPGAAGVADALLALTA